ncbi:MAG: winged helix-turn-helix domain-containing protein [Pseudomonadales bacterium]|jgi:DNA-binding winged helix-turn-helix (wHTH) protein/TolB-like protein/Tfp pilus assembly protein PilF
MAADGTQADSLGGNATRLRIGDLEVRPGTRQVFRGGQLIRLPRLSYRLLMALADAAPDLLTQEELVEKVWPGRVVSPETVTQRVRLLRRALGDDARDSRYVGLVRGEGYRLLADVGPADADSHPPKPGFPAGSVWLLAGLSVVLVGVVAVFRIDDRTVLDVEPERLSVAVLRFDNQTGNPDLDYLSDGLSRELSDLLGVLPGLRVAAASSTFALKDTQLDDQEIARRLGVRHLIRGALDMNQDRLAVTVWIRDPWHRSSPSNLTFERPRNELPALQQEIATQIVQVLSPGSDAAVPLRAASLDPSAHDLLLLGRHLELQMHDQVVVDENLLSQVIDVYRRAVVADPASAAAQSRMAGVLLFRGDSEAAEPFIQQALALDPDSAEVQYTLGLLRWRRGDSDGGEAFSRAVALNPNDADALAELAKWEWHQARADLARSLFERALTLDRMSLKRYADLGNFYGLCRMPAEAIDIANRVLQRFPDPAGLQVAARIFEVAGRLDLAIAWATEAELMAPERQEAAWQVAELYARIGDLQAAARHEPVPGAAQLFFGRRYDALLELATDRLIDDPGDVKLYYLLGFAYDAIGRPANAVRLLTIAGLPDAVYTDARRADAIEALVTLADAHAQIGELDKAREYAGWIKSFMQRHLDVGVQVDWWPYLYQACALEILGERDAALERLSGVAGGSGLPWYPPLRDLGCFRRLEDVPEYQRVVGKVEERMSDLRSRLPAALAGLVARSERPG